MPSGGVSELPRLAWPLLIVTNSFFTLQIFIDRILLSHASSTAVGAGMVATMLFWGVDDSGPVDSKLRHDVRCPTRQRPAESAALGYRLIVALFQHRRRRGVSCSSLRSPVILSPQHSTRTSCKHWKWCNSRCLCFRGVAESAHRIGVQLLRGAARQPARHAHQHDRLDRQRRVGIRAHFRGAGGVCRRGGIAGRRALVTVLGSSVSAVVALAPLFLAAKRGRICHYRPASWALSRPCSCG